jgi:hypothetical protein
MRKTNILWLCLAVLCSVVLFYTSQRVTDGREKIATLDAATEKENESIRVLETEWSYLNQPDRLEKLAGTHLHLQAMKGRQFAAATTIDMLPPDASVAVASIPEIKTEKVVVKTPQKIAPPPQQIVKILKPATEAPLAKAALPAPKIAVAEKKKDKPVTLGSGAKNRAFGDVMKSLGVE